jgi:Protein of unknown function (DUF2950)
MPGKETSRASFPLRLRIAIPLLAVPLLASVPVGEAAQSGQRTFHSVEEASRALFVAVEAGETDGLTQILGQGNELISSSDAAQDRLDRERFVRKYQQMHRLVRERNGEVILYIGAENWPFPIPLVAHDGVWSYDSDAGQEEVLYRLVGENEVTAIEVCHELLAASKGPRQSADANDHVDPLLASARTDGRAVALHGYYFRFLPTARNDAFGVVAYPAEYGVSGVMTFVVDSEGVVYQKDLGPGTTEAATKIGAPHTDATWKPAEPGLADHSG